MKRIAILLASHNRRSQTLTALSTIRNQTLPNDVQARVFLFDDGSTDGTVEVVRAEFPDLQLLRGDGSAFWNGGMRQAFAAASAVGYDFYLLLNDDTRLENDALHRLLQAHEGLCQKGYLPIVVGAVCDPITGELTYGGVRRAIGWPTQFPIVTPGISPVQCDTFNANCVLIPEQVALRVGNLDPGFTHGMGDYDYGLRAGAFGATVWLAPGYLGTCARNAAVGTWRDGTLPLKTRWRKLLSPKGLPPREWLRFTRSHGGMSWPLLFISPYVHCLVAGVVGRRQY